MSTPAVRDPTYSTSTLPRKREEGKKKRKKEPALTPTTGSPGADRVVFNPSYQGSCVYAGAMTHTDAPTRNGFVECEEATGGSGSGTTSSVRPTGTASSTVSGTSSAPTSTGTGEPEDNAAVSVRAMEVQGLVVVGVVGGLLWL